MICLLHHWPFIPYTIHIETNQKSLYGLIIDLILVRSATFSNISAMVWRLVLVVEEAGIHAENHRPWASNWKTLSFALRVEYTLFVIYKAVLLDLKLYMYVL
jgi:hypothetical protein